MIRCILYWTVVALMCLSSLAAEKGKGADTQTQVIEPEFQPVVVQKGGSFRLVCRQSNCKEVEWYKNEEKINSIPDTGFLITNQQVGTDQDCKIYSNLTKTNAQISDTENYSCKVKNGGDSYVVQVFVVEITSKNGTFAPNQDVTIYCIVEGVTSYHPLFWWRNGEQITMNKDKYETDSKNNSLTIKKISLLDIGEYICKFEYKGNSYNQTVVIESEPYVHKFETKSKNLVEGDPLVLDCKAKGYPLPEITWLKDGMPLDTEDQRVSFDIHEGIENATLRLEDLTFSDRAEYICLAFNNLGSSNQTITVRVKNKLAALWPFLGICAEVIVLCVIIFIYEKRRAKKMEEEDAPEEAGHLTNSHDHKGKDDVRHRK